jgi:hypothetical protein
MRGCFPQNLVGAFQLDDFSFELLQTFALVGLTCRGVVDR